MTLDRNMIHFARPYTSEREVIAAAAAIRSGWLSQGHRTVDFEQAVAVWTGARFGIATSNGTTALDLIYHLVGISEWDEVIVPSFTCMATVNPLLQMGAVPVFVDIDPATYNLDPAAIDRAISTQTYAIVAVHQIGLPADYTAIRAVAEKYGLALIEDGACALGATCRGQRVGNLGSPTAFSFHPRKIVTTGEGGMVMTNDEEFAEKARILRSQGASTSDLERHQSGGLALPAYPEPGFNYRLTDIQAAIGVVQMERLDWLLARRQEIAAYYNQHLGAIEEITIPYVPDYATHSYQSYLIRLHANCKVKRDDLVRGMIERGIPVRHGIAPLHREPYFWHQARYQKLDLPATEEASASTMFLPIYADLTEGQQEQIVTTLKELLCHR